MHAPRTLLWLCCLLPTLAFASNTVNRVVAIVNDDVITENELQRATQMLSPQLAQRGASVAARQTALESLIDERLLGSAMRKASLEVSEDEYQTALQAFLRERRLTEGQLRTALAQQGVTMDSFKQRLMNEIKQMKFLQEQVGSRIALSDEEMRAFYERNPGAFATARTRQSRVRVGEIFLGAPAQATAKAQRAVQQKAQRIAREAQHGDFAAVAKQHSEGPEAAQGGELGIVDPTQMHPRVAAAIAQLRIGAVSAPIRSQRGWHILKLLDRSASGDDDFARVKPQIQAALYQRKMRDAIEQYVAELRAQAYIEVVRR